MWKLLLIIAAAGLFILTAIYYSDFQGIWPVIKSPPEDITELIPPSEPTPAPAENKTGMPLELPPGFSISIFAKNLPGARVMKFDSFGNMWLSRTSKGAVSLIETNNGVAVRQNDVFTNLRKPHGLAFNPEFDTSLFIAEEDKISRVSVYSEDKLNKIIGLPASGNHTSRTIGFGPDSRLYVANGSTCNVCHEQDNRRAKIHSLNKDGSDFREFAKGLRNTVFFVWHPETKKMWGTDMGRDYLGDDLPPDEVNIIEEGKNYGWPICYGKNVHDTDFDKNAYVRSPCMEPFEMPSHIDIPAHSAPLGLAFIPKNSSWPKDYWGDLLIAYHGSWNRTTPTGYKIVRAKLDDDGNFLGFEDFITGWIRPDGALGRPVDLVFDKGGALYISDDKAGLVYRVSATSAKPVTSAKPCMVTGCSSQICAEEDIVTTCEYRPEYACYKTAKCERQSDGKCGWTPTAELASCLRETPFPILR